MKKYQTLHGNNNALKEDDPATAYIQQRVTMARKNRYVAQARREGLSLSEWIQKHCDAACDAADSGTEREDNGRNDTGNTAGGTSRKAGKN